MMNKVKRVLTGSLLCSLLVLTLSSCGQEYDYSSYYNVSTGKGIEVYVWKDGRDIYQSCLIYGSNRLKTVDEIGWMQNNLPAPLDKMKEILQSYDEETRNYAYICYISYPVIVEELAHVSNYTENEEIYEYIYNKLELSN